MNRREKPDCIVVTTPTFLPVVGGAELGIHEIYRRVGQATETIVLTRRHPDRILREYGSDYPTGNSYRVVYALDALIKNLPNRFGYALGTTGIPFALEILRVSRRHRIIALNAHFARPNLAVLLVARYLLRIRVVLSLVGRSDVVGELSPLRRLYARMAVRAAHVVAPNSSFYLGAEATAANEKVAVIPFGVDTSEFAPNAAGNNWRGQWSVPEDAFVFLAVQRLAPIKRVDIVLEAFSKIRAAGADAWLVVVGRGPEADRLAKVSRELGISDRVRFTGFVDDDALPGAFASSDAFVSHSLVETFGVTFAQAMSSGLPIVAAATSCIPEVVTEKSGDLIEPFSVPDFADAMSALVADRAETAARGAANRRRAIREFEWSVIADEYRLLLQANQPQG